MTKHPETEEGNQGNPSGIPGKDDETSDSKQDIGSKPSLMDKVKAKVHKS